MYSEFEFDGCHYWLRVDELRTEDLRGTTSSGCFIAHYSFADPSLSRGTLLTDDRGVTRVFSSASVAQLAAKIEAEERIELQLSAGD